MSWTRYLLHDFWTASEFNRIEASDRRTRRAQRRSRQHAREEREALGHRVEELEQELAESALLLRSLAELCMEKGVLSPEEIAAKVELIDSRDGEVDGRMSKPEEP